MKSIRVIFALMFVVVCTLLAACGGSIQAPTTPTAEKPLITDADIDNAQLLLPTEVKELVGIEGGEATAGQGMTVASDVVLSQQSTQTGLLGGDSWIYYIQADTTPTNAPDARSLVPGPTTYSVYGKSAASDSPVLIYSGAREIQSISVHNTHNILFSMRETTDPSSDFEIFFRTNSGGVDQFTDDDVDNTNVSTTSYSDYIVYEELVSGRPSIVLRTNSGTNAPVVRLSSAYPQRHPNLSGDGKQIVFVRDLPNGYDSIMKYTLATNIYSLVVDTTPTNARLTPVTLDFPSVSHYADKVLWLESNRTVKLKNLSTGSVQTVASDATIKRPHLNYYGTFMTYQQGRNVYYKNLQTAQVWAFTNNSSFVNSYGAVPSLYLADPTLQVTVTGLPSGQNRVRLVRDDGYVRATFDSSRTFSLYPGTYTITAESFSTGLPYKPTCKTYTPTPASQTITLARGEARSVSVTYTVSPCNP